VSFVAPRTRIMHTDRWTSGVYYYYYYYKCTD